jgi:hypothetical protein
MQEAFAIRQEAAAQREQVLAEAEATVAGWLAEADADRAALFGAATTSAQAALEQAAAEAEASRGAAEAARARAEAETARLTEEARRLTEHLAQMKATAESLVDAAATEAGALLAEAVQQAGTKRGDAPSLGEQGALTVGAAVVRAQPRRHSDSDSGPGLPAPRGGVVADDPGGDAIDVTDPAVSPETTSGDCNGAEPAMAGGVGRRRRRARRP